MCESRSTRDMIRLTGYNSKNSRGPIQSFAERLGINAVMNSEAIYLNESIIWLFVLRENDRKSFGVAEYDNELIISVSGTLTLLDDVLSGETNVAIRDRQQRTDTFAYILF